MSEQLFLGRIVYRFIVFFRFVETGRSSGGTRQEFLRWTNLLQDKNTIGNLCPRADMLSRCSDVIEID